MSKELELLYKQYDRYKSDRRPESASQCAEKIMDYGLKNRKLSHAANAAMMIYSANSDWSTEPIEQLLGNITRIGQSKWLSPTDEATLLFIRIAAISSAYDLSHLDYSSQSPTPTLDSVDCFSNDLGKWTRAQYEQVLAALLPKLFAHREALLKVSALSYKPLFDLKKKGKANPIDHSKSSLYMAMVNTLSKDSFFNICPTIADEYRLAATVLDASADRMCLEKHLLDFRLHQHEINSKAYFVELKALIDKYRHEPSVVELVSELAENYINQEEYLTALSLLDEYINRYPQYYRINVLHGLKEGRLLAPSLDFRATNQLTSTGPLYLKVNSRLVESVIIELYEAHHIDPYAASLNSVYQQLKPYREAKRKALLRKEFKLSPSPSMKQVQDSLLLTSNLKKGMYVIRLAEAKTSSQKSLAGNVREVQLISVSDIFVLRSYSPKRGHELQVFDANSGKASSSTAVNLYSNDRFHSRVETDHSGRCYLPEGYFEYYPFRDGDAHHFLVNSHGSNIPKLNRTRRLTKLAIVSDRAIYRPGQRLQFFGQRYSIGYRAEDAKVEGGASETILFLDPSAKEIARIECPVDEFGRFDGSFEIPTGQLNGSYSVVDLNKNDFCHVQVEEYKRPSFKVKLEEPSESYSLGSRLEINGSAIAYSGLPIQKAQVSYRLSLSKFSFWRFSSGENEILSSGNLESDLEGRFTIPVSLDAQNKDEIENSPWIFYRVVLEADVTGPNGETHSSQLILPLGREPINLELRMPQGFDWQKEALPQLRFEALNMKGVSVEKTICYRLLNARDKSLIHEYQVQSDSSIAAPAEWAKLPSGEYLLSYCLAEDKADSALWKDQQIYLFSLKDAEYKGTNKLWSYLIESEFDASQPAEVLLALGSPQAKRYLYYDLSDASGYVERKMIPVEDSRFIRLKLAARKADLPENMTLTLYFVANNELQQSTHQFARKQAKRGYSFVWSSFRDKLEPGSKETWSLQIRDAEGKPLSRPSILAAWMYDASLDALVTPQPKLPLASSLSYPVSHHSLLRSFNEVYLNANWTSISFDLPGITSVVFDPKRFLYSDFFFDSKLDNVVSGYGGAPKMQRSMAVREEKAKQIIALDVAEAEAESKASLPEEQKDEAAALRSNFAETAFFYPRLLANSKGEVSWSFTLPESLTRWRLELFALGQDLQSAQRTEWIEAKKDFMIQPNLPRFLRQGDEGVASISIRNESDSQQLGVLSMQLIDPHTEQVLFEDEVPFEVKAKNTSTVSVPLKSIDGYDAVAIRLLAKSAHFSDGEQHLLPLLPATEYITESIPLHVKAGESQTVDLNKLFPHDSGRPAHAELRFEAVANPLWVALEAMPTVIDTSDDDLVSLASALYCNHLAQTLSKSPALKAWIANFEANPTTKLEHTNTDPWQRYRQMEHENKLRLKQLIQSDSLPINEAKLIDKIAKLQQSDGSFSWYPRMSGSTYLTQYALRLFARLDKLSHGVAVSNRLAAIQNKAWGFADASAVELMKDLQEYQKRSNVKVKTLPSQALNYLYLLQLTERTPASKANEARTYFLGILLNSLSHIALKEMPLAAIVLDAAGHKAHADKFRQSLREHLKPGPDGDLHFNLPNRGYYWRDARYGLQTECIEALVASNEQQDQERIEQMQAWLLNQKRTQLWPALPATTDAIYGLLLGKGAKLVSHEATLALRLPGKDESLEFGASKGTHIFPVESLPQGDITARVDRDGEGFAWAAFYAEYVVPSHAVRATSNGISLTKRFYREQIKDGKVYLEPLELGATLEVGEVLLSRFEIDLERDMDFVKLSDDRSACLDPMAASSYYDYAAGTLYYCEIKDAATNMYFDMLRSGSYVLELRSRVSHAGVFAPGLARIACSYAPEYNARTGAAESLKVDQ